MSVKAGQLREALLDLLLDVVQNGVVVETEDGPARITPPAPTLSVALAAVKAFAPPAEADSKTVVEAQNVSRFLARFQPEGKPA